MFRTLFDENSPSKSDGWLPYPGGVIHRKDAGFNRPQGVKGLMCYYSAGLLRHTKVSVLVSDTVSPGSAEKCEQINLY